jgi:hypothetical protein
MTRPGEVETEPSELRPALALTLQFRVRSREKAGRELARVAELIGEQLQLRTSERYWKIPEWWTCVVELRLEARTASELVAECLLRANRIANGWYVLGPHLAPDGTLESFDGIFKRTPGFSAQPQSLEWAEFVYIPRPVTVTEPRPVLGHDESS